MLPRKLVTLAILALSVAWWIVDPGFEPVITAAAAIAGLGSAGVVSAKRQGRDEGARIAPETGQVAPKVDRDAAPLSFTTTPHAVGRRQVVEALERHLEDCAKTGRGRMVCVTGEAGIAEGRSERGRERRVAGAAEARPDTIL